MFATLNTYDLQRETALIMGWEYKYVFGKFVIHKKGEPSAMYHAWNPHANTEEALEIVKKFMMKMHWNGVEWVVYSDYTDAGLIQAKHVELPIAICLAIIEHRDAGRR